MRATRAIAAGHPAFAGHFPGAPLLPGVLLLAEVMEAACADAAVARRFAAGSTLVNAKFLAPVRPGATLALAFEADDAGLRFEVTEAGQVAAKGQWTWTKEPA